MSFPASVIDPMEFARQIARSRAEFMKMIDEQIKIVLDPATDIDMKYQALFKVCTKDRKLYQVNENLFRLLDNEVRIQRIYKEKGFKKRLKMSQERSDRIIRLILKRAYPDLINKTTIMLDEKSMTESIEAV